MRSKRGRSLVELSKDQSDERDRQGFAEIAVGSVLDLFVAAGLTAGVAGMLGSVVDCIGKL